MSVEIFSVMDYPGFAIAYNLTGRKYLDPDRVLVIVEVPHRANNIGARVMESGYELLVVTYDWSRDLIDIAKLLTRERVVETPYHPLYTATEAAIDAVTTGVEVAMPHGTITVELPFAVVEAAPERMTVSAEELEGGCVVAKVKV